MKIDFFLAKYICLYILKHLGASTCIQKGMYNVYFTLGVW